MTVRLSPAVLTSLLEIWEWNADKNGEVWADDYHDFLTNTISQLSETFRLGIRVEYPSASQYELYFVVAKKNRRRGANGHIVVYARMESEILVVGLYHEAQNWRTRLGSVNPEN